MPGGARRRAVAAAEIEAQGEPAPHPADPLGQVARRFVEEEVMPGGARRRAVAARAQQAPVEDPPVVRRRRRLSRPGHALRMSA